MKHINKKFYILMNCWRSKSFLFGTVKQFSFITCFILLLLLPSLSRTDTFEMYEEIRVHSSKLEARLADWSKRAEQHSYNMRTSDHYKLVHWRTQLSSLNFHDELSGLKKLNRMINNDIAYIDDYHHYHKEDFWADPETTLIEGGDCEDIALVKAATLKLFDWPNNKMHLLVGYLTERGKKESHAVLLVETSDGDQLVLRSITNDVVHPSEFGFIPAFAVDSAGTLIVKLMH